MSVHPSVGWSVRPSASWSVGPSKHVQTTQQNHFIHIFSRDQAVAHAKFSVESDYKDKEGLRSENLRLHGAFTWRHFRLIVIGAFYPFLASFVHQRTLFALYNN